MTKCFKLDVIIIKSSLKIYLVLISLAVILSFAIKSSFGLTYLFMLAMIVSCAPFSFESNTKITKFINTLPVKKSDQVKGRYLFLCSMLIFAWIVSTIIVYLKYNLGAFEYANVISCFLAGITVSILSLIQYPLYYKFGLIKGRLFNTVLYLLPIILVMMLPQITLGTIISILEPENFGFAIIAFVGLFALVLLSSYFLSKSIIKNKEV